MDYKNLVAHVGHSIECVRYGEVNVSIGCVDCNVVLHEEENDLKTNFIYLKREF